VRTALARRLVATTAFWVWVVVLFVIATSLGAAHLHALPKPTRSDAALPHAVNELRSDREQNAWLAVHVLYAQCRCSQGILRHLASGSRPASVVEKVLLVGETPGIASELRALSARNFRIVTVSADELRDRYHVEAAPLLLVLGPDGAVRYSGGYTDRKQGPVIRDRAILAELMSQKETRELPVFGCAVSRELQRLLDPLALKERNEAP
jgi:hypothetical protein